MLELANVRFWGTLFGLWGIGIILIFLALTGWNLYLPRGFVTLFSEFGAIVGALVAAVFGFIGMVTDFRTPARDGAPSRISAKGKTAAIGLSAAFLISTLAQISKSDLEDKRQTRLLVETLRGVYRIQDTRLGFSVRLPAAKGHGLKFFSEIKRRLSGLDLEQAAKTFGINNCGQILLGGRCRVDDLKSLHRVPGFNEVISDLRHIYWRLEFFSLQDLANKAGSGLSMQVSTELGILPSVSYGRQYNLTIANDSLPQSSGLDSQLSISEVRRHQLWLDFAEEEFVLISEFVPLDALAWFETGRVVSIPDLLGGVMRFEPSILSRWESGGTLEWVTLQINGWGRICIDNKLLKHGKTAYVHFAEVSVPSSLELMRKRFGPDGKAYSC